MGGLRGGRAPLVGNWQKYVPSTVAGFAASSGGVGGAAVRLPRPPARGAGGGPPVDGKIFLPVAS